MPESVYLRCQNPGGGIIVSGAIATSGNVPLLVMDWCFNVSPYIEMLDVTHLEEEDIFPIKVTLRALSTLSRSFRDMIPDLNPIKNDWGWTTSSVYKNRNQYNTVEGFKSSILKALGPNGRYISATSYFKHEQPDFWNHPERLGIHMMLSMLFLHGSLYM